MTIKPMQLQADTILAGATYDFELERSFFPYPTEVRDEKIYKLDGSEAPEVDRVMEDYTNCTAAMELRDGQTNDLLATRTTEDGGISLSGATLAIHFDATGADSTSTLTPFESAIGHVEVRRNGGPVIERQYELTFSYSAQKTEIDPA